MTDIEVVFFDVDQTLVDFDGAATRAHGELFGDPATYVEWREITPRFFPRFLSGELDFETMRVLRMGHYLQLHGLAGDPLEWERRRWALIERGYEVYDDVLACLEALRMRGLRLGVITNNEPVHQRQKLTTVGLIDAFDGLVISGEVGHAKPSREIFDHAVRALGVAPSRAVHVGDLLDVDARGATQAGIRGVWLDRDDRHDGSTLEVEVVTGLHQLPALLG